VSLAAVPATERRASNPLGPPLPSTPAAEGSGRRQRRLRLRHLTIGYFGLALLAMVLNDPTQYVADARFEHYWAGQQFLERHATLWDASRTLGRPTQFFSPVVAFFVATFELAGSPPALTQRLLHAVYLTLAGVGAVQVLRLFRPRLGAEHLLAGALFMFNPYTSQFLVPSGLFLHYALSPWFVVTAIRGARSRETRWAWAAGFALAVFSLGALNTASLLYALLPLAPVSAYLVWIERDFRWRALGAWAWRAGLLTAGCTAAAAVVVLFSAPVVAENLTTTELPQTVSSRSSWSESWRGLGSWLTYFYRPGGGPLRPEALPYLFHPVVVTVTFALPLLAIVTLWRSRWRARLCFGVLMATGLVAMVGLYPPGDAPPLGAGLESLVDRFLFARSFRNTYKAGSTFMLGLACLVAVGIVDAGRIIRQAPPRRPLAAKSGRAWTAAAVVATLLVVSTAAFPFWTGNLYSTEDRLNDVPQYWHDALGWVDSQPDFGSVLVLPGVNRARYRWGYPGDDLFDALLARQHGVRSSLAQGTPQIADLLAALDDRVVAGDYEPGTLRRVAEMIGIRWVIVRNDLEWQALRLPRPAAFDVVRADPSLGAVATFGEPGENVIDGDDRSPAAGRERELAPVEIFDTGVEAAPVRLLAPGPPMLVAGDGDGLVTLAARGMIDGRRATMFTAAMQVDELREAVGAGAPIVITDSNRRRIERVTTTRNLASATLPAGIEGGLRPPIALFNDPGTQSVVTYGDAISVTASSYGVPFEPGAAWARPANAFDGSDATAWTVGHSLVERGAAISVELAEPRAIAEVALRPMPTTSGQRQVSAVILRVDGRSSDAIRLDDDETIIRLPDAGEARRVEIHIAELTGSGNAPVGFAEVRLGDLDVAERVQVPDDVFRAAERDPDLAAMLDEADVTFVFQRQTGRGNVESGVHRRFRTSGERDYVLRGVAQRRIDTPEAGDRLLETLATGECVELVRLDGQAVPVRAVTDTLEARPDAPMTFTGCGPIALDAGWHELRSADDAANLLTSVWLSTGTVPTPSPPAETVLFDGSVGGGRAAVDELDGGQLLFNQGFSPHWVAYIDGHEVPALGLSTVNGWVLPADAREVRIVYGPERVYRVALAGSLVSVAVCLALAAWPARRLGRD
jgi:arabinofuranan 3-O-arabinosyltransferase